MTRKRLHNVTITIDDETWNRMHKFEDVNWTGMCRMYIKKYMDMREYYDTPITKMS